MTLPPLQALGSQVEEENMFLERRLGTGKLDDREARPPLQDLAQPYACSGGKGLGGNGEEHAKYNWIKS